MTISNMEGENILKDEDLTRTSRTPGEEARGYFETPRRTPRHGTRRTLRALSMAMLILSHPAWVKGAIALLLNIMWKATARCALLSPTQIYLPHAMGP